jgi:hypothetical protein
MNTTARRIVTTLAGVALAASALAATGPAAVAAKSGTGSSPVPIEITVSDLYSSMDPPTISAYTLSFAVPVDPVKITSEACTLDGFPTACGRFTPLSSSLKRGQFYSRGFDAVAGVTPTEHTFTATIVAGKTTYSGTAGFTLGL